jgi:hypothetical protein
MLKLSSELVSLESTWPTSDGGSVLVGAHTDGLDLDVSCSARDDLAFQDVIVLVANECLVPR